VMSEVEDRVYALIDVAGQQQGSVQAALDGLAAERLALQRERQALARGVEAMRQGASAAVRLAVQESLAAAGLDHRWGFCVECALVAGGCGGALVG